MWTGVWPSREMAQVESGLQDLKNLVNSLDASERVAGEMARFLVVRTCGYLEQMVELSCCSYLRSKSDPRSAAFGESWLGRGKSPTPGNLILLVSKFDSVWSRELKEFLDEDDELLKRELEFLVSRRHRISHGLNQGIGMRRALDLVPPVLQVSAWFELRFDPR